MRPRKTPSFAEPMKYGVLDDAAIAQVFRDDSFKKRRRHARIPDTFGIYRHDRATGANAKAGCFGSLDARRTEKEILPLEQGSETTVQSSPTAVWRTETAGAHEHVAAVWLHFRTWHADSECSVRR